MVDARNTLNKLVKRTQHIDIQTSARLFLRFPLGNTQKCYFAKSQIPGLHLLRITCKSVSLSHTHTLTHTRKEILYHGHLHLFPDGFKVWIREIKFINKE